MKSVIVTHATDEYDDRINCRIGELKKKLEEKERSEPGKPKISQLVRRYIELGLQHEAECAARRTR